MGNLTMSRRTFVKTAAITGAAAAAFGASTHTALAEETYSSVSGNDTVAVKTCCRGCGKMECGVKVIVQNGRAIRVEGDEGAFQSMGNCCTKSQSSIQAAYHPAGGSQPQADRHRQVPASGLVAVLVRQPFAVGRRHHGRPLPGARPLERVRQLHEPDEHHARLGGPVLA